LFSFEVPHFILPSFLIVFRLRGPYFVLLAAFTVDEGDAAGDGAGLAAGLGFVAGGALVSAAGEDDVAGDDVVAGEFVLVAGSQAATNASVRIAESRSVVRLSNFIFGLLISFASLEQD
jgi:hypothetical protein